ncbi:MAG: hypothetical protein KDA63_07075 [Planctomycetales bacterium]|nr:hypothetical protein [Planctomycetales bacterium]
MNRHIVWAVSAFCLVRCAAATEVTEGFVHHWALYETDLAGAALDSVGGNNATMLWVVGGRCCAPIGAALAPHHRYVEAKPSKPARCGVFLV